MHAVKCNEMKYRAEKMGQEGHLKWLEGELKTWSKTL